MAAQRQLCCVVVLSLKQHNTAISLTSCCVACSCCCSAADSASASDALPSAAMALLRSCSSNTTTHSRPHTPWCQTQAGSKVIVWASTLCCWLLSLLDWPTGQTSPAVTNQPTNQQSTNLQPPCSPAPAPAAELPPSPAESAAPAQQTQATQTAAGPVVDGCDRVTDKHAQRSTIRG